MATAILVGIGIWAFLRIIFTGFYSIDQNERAVITTFGRAERLHGDTGEGPDALMIREDERHRYVYPVVQVVQPGLHFKFPWQKVHRVSIATQTAGCLPVRAESGQPAPRMM